MIFLAVEALEPPMCCSVALWYRCRNELLVGNQVVSSTCRCIPMVGELVLVMLEKDLAFLVLLQSVVACI